MNGAGITFVVFTKPWKIPLPELAAFVKGLGFDGIELPVRPGFQVEPQDVARKLPEAVRILGDLGVSIASVAGPTDEPTIAACAAAGVPLIRICVAIRAGTGYLAHAAHLQRELGALVPVLERYGVAQARRTAGVPVADLSARKGWDRGRGQHHGAGKGRLSWRPTVMCCSTP